MAGSKLREQSGAPHVARLGFKYAGSAPGANTSIFGGAGLSVSEGASAIRVTVCLTTSSVFNVVTNSAGGTDYTNGLNASVALNAGDVYTFTFGALAYDAAGNRLGYDFQVETDSVIRFLIVDEVVGAVV